MTVLQITRTKTADETYWPCSGCGEHEQLGQMFDADSWSPLCSACADDLMEG